MILTIILIISYIIVFFGVYGNLKLIRIFAWNQEKVSNFNGLTSLLATFDTILIISLAIKGTIYIYQLGDTVLASKVLGPINYMAITGGTLRLMNFSCQQPEIL